MKTRYAIIDGERTKPDKGLKGKCPCCGELMIAKCGDVKAWHWAHKSKLVCDPWWENETEWHKQWKNKFPDSWQEVLHMDETTGEKHIADVKSNTGMFIEFQYSPIKPDEQLARELFYKDMIWVVNGARRKTDYSRFRRGLDMCRTTNLAGIFITNFADEMFPASWINRAVPVLFDFAGAEGSDERLVGDLVWCLLPVRNDVPRGLRQLVGVSKAQLVQYATNSDEQGNLFDKLKIINSKPR